EFVEFARAHSWRLVHAAYLLTGDRHQAEDAAQTTLARTYAAWSRVRRQDAYAYARTVLVNHLTDGWRRPLREQPTSELPDVPRRDHADEVIDRQWLMQALAGLTHRERTVLVLRHFFDMSEVDTARELNLSLGAVKSINSRALAKLRVRTASPTATGAAS